MVANGSTQGPITRGAAKKNRGKWLGQIKGIMTTLVVDGSINFNGAMSCI